MEETGHRSKHAAAAEQHGGLGVTDSSACLTRDTLAAWLR
jgi:hypothetical protein